MRKVVVALAVCLATFAAAVDARAAVIYQAFNQRFVDVEAMLDELKALGYDYVQVSPAQKSLDLPDWWSLYQPVDYLILGNRLGDVGELQSLIREAHARDLKVLVDVVLNHMADPVMSGHPDLNYPTFAARDFHFADSRRCISDWRSREQVTKYWLCDPSRNHHLADLDTSSEHVREVHRQHLRMLLDLGVDGFRFDAMKHIETEYFASVVPTLPSGKFHYGEVIGESMAESQAYTGFMPVTDFHLLRVLLDAFSVGGDLRWLKHPEGVGAALPGSDAVVFSRNHDTAMAPAFFNFGDYRDAMLANAFVVGRGVGTALVYRDDYREPLVVGALKFAKRMDGRGAYVRAADEVCAGACDPRTLLFVERDRAGLMIINSADRWVDSPTAHVPGLAVGCYREVTHDFPVTVRQGSDGRKWVYRWGSGSRGGLRIGPRTALFLTKTPQNDCESTSFQR